MSEGSAPATPAAEAAPPDAPPVRKGPPPEQVAATVAWATSVFARWYAAHPPPMPPRHGRREFGFIPAPRPPPDRTPFFRHTALRSRDELRHYLTRNAPWHCYYSTAYYEKPDAPTMKEKNWLGADLIFDLDADHLEGADKLSFEEQLREVRRQAVRLVEEFLIPDFGFDPAQMQVVFSGGRGYHVHVRDPRVQQLGAAERREIVDYVSPRPELLAKLLSEFEGEKALSFNTATRKRERDTVFPPTTAAGWKGHYARFVIEYLREALALPEREGVRKLASIKGIGEKRASEILAQLVVEDAAWAGNQSIRESRLTKLERGYIEAVPALRRCLTYFRDGLQERTIALAPGETDEPVTADVKRLIRMPGSLHGKTGLRVTPITIDELRTFDPLAQAAALPDDPVKVVVGSVETVRLAGETVTTKPGLNEVPLRHAMFLVLRRKALVPL